MRLRRIKDYMSIFLKENLGERQNITNMQKIISK